mmetsp:Transcript_10895/g.33402  ORF Transcript_10895/g.33402 Transcript_10895/m.33402 type:complete len:235 (-) Transcript_10895:725-1429(-)
MRFMSNLSSRSGMTLFKAASSGAAFSSFISLYPLPRFHPSALSSVYTCARCFPGGASEGSHTVGMDIMQVQPGAAMSSPSKTTTWCPIRFSKPSAENPTCKCMKLSTAGVVSCVSLNFLGRAPGASSFPYVSQIVAFEMTTFALIVFPEDVSTPVACPRETLIRFTGVRRRTSPPNFSMPRISASTIATAPPSGYSSFLFSLSPTINATSAVIVPSAFKPESRKHSISIIRRTN